MFGKKKDVSKYRLYDIIPSQNAMYLMYKFGLHKQQAQIPASITVTDYDFDFELLQKAFDIEIQRNESLRNRFVKVGKEIKQYFIDDFSYEVPVKYFKNLEEQEEFFSKDAPIPVHFLKDETFRMYFFKTEGAGCGIYANVSHLIMDAMGLAGCFFDLLRVYRSLRKGTEMPPALDSYKEQIVQVLKNAENTEKMKKHEQFYKDYFLKNGEPFYAAVHGPEFLEKYRAKKKDPNIRVPMAYNPLWDKCDMIVESISSEDTEKIFNFCREKQISPESVFEFGFRTYCSAINYRIDDVSMMAVCSKRATVKEKNMCGCLAEPLILRTKIGEDLTFTQALGEMVRVRTNLYRHLDYPYTKARDMSLELFNYGPIQGANSLMYSWIPMPMDDSFGYKFHYRTYNLERYFTPLYAITIPDSIDKNVNVYYMYRVKLSTKEQMKALHRNMVSIILKGIENNDITVKELLDSVK